MSGPRVVHLFVPALVLVLESGHHSNLPIDGDAPAICSSREDRLCSRTATKDLKEHKKGRLSAHERPVERPRLRSRGEQGENFVANLLSVCALSCETSASTD